MRVAIVVAHVLAHQRDVLGRDFLAQAYAHQLVEQFGARVVDGGRGNPVGQDRESGGLDLVANIGTEASRWIGDQAYVTLGPTGIFEPFSVPRPVKQTQDQGPQIGSVDALSQ